MSEQRDANGLYPPRDPFIGTIKINDADIVHDFRPTPPSDAVSNDVERVARAIWTAPILGQPIGYQVRRWPPSNPDAKVEAYRQARAAIASLSSNTDEVTEAMIAAARKATAWSGNVSDGEYRAIYLAMRSAR